MEDDLLALQERIERLLSNARRLTDENSRLRTELADALAGREHLERRMQEARARVEAALSRLPGRPLDAAH
jgi:uncharacterized protein (TIGR02449 family)